MNNLSKFFILILLIGCSQNSSTVAGETNKREQHKHINFVPQTGAFEQSSYLCSTLSGDGSCDEGIADCLSVTPSGGDLFIVNLYSVQANQHICSMSVPMSPIEDALFYNGSEGKFTLRMESKNGHFFIETTGTPEEDDNIYCGVHASIDGYRIQNHTKSKSIQICPSP